MFYMDLNDNTAESLRSLARRLEQRARDLPRDSFGGANAAVRARFAPEPAPVPAPPEPVQAPPAPVRLPPAREKVAVIGRSRRGAPIRCYTIGDGPNLTLVLGAFHGDERNTAGVVERLRQSLRSEPARLAGSQVALVPLVNPDGWSSGTRGNASRIDINRNFPAGWRPVARAMRYFPGLYPASEPETRALMALMDRLRPRKVIAIHNPLRCLNFDGDNGQKIALAMRRHNRYPVRADIGYPTPGSFGTQFGRNPGIGIVTLELPPIGVEAAWRENRAALHAAIALRVT